MTYFMVPAELPMRMVAAKVPPAARWMYVALGTYSANLLKDGYVDVPLSMLTDDPQAVEHVETLIAAGFVERDEDRLYLPEFLEHNKTATDLERLREQARTRKRRWTLHTLHNDHSECTDRCEVRKRHNSGNHDRCIGEWCSPGTFLERSGTMHYTTRLNTKRSEVLRSGEDSDDSAVVSAPQRAAAAESEREYDPHFFLNGPGPICLHCEKTFDEEDHIELRPGFQCDALTTLIDAGAFAIDEWLVPCETQSERQFRAQWEDRYVEVIFTTAGKGLRGIATSALPDTEDARHPQDYFAAHPGRIRRQWKEPLYGLPGYTEYGVQTHLRDLGDVQALLAFHDWLRCTDPLSAALASLTPPTDQGAPA